MGCCYSGLFGAGGRQAPNQPLLPAPSQGDEAAVKLAQDVHHFESLTSPAEHTHSVADVAPLVAAAKANLEDHLKEQPTGPEDTLVMTKHLLAAFSKSVGAIASFVDAEKDTATENIMKMMGDTEKSFTLILDAPHEGHTDSIFTEGVEQQRFRDDCRKRLARAHGVEESRVIVGKVSRGSVKVDFLIMQMDPHEVGQNLDKLRKEFRPTFKDVKVDIAAVVMGFDVSKIDTRGNKDFSKRDRPFFMVGPKNNQRKYVQPQGWYRVGIPPCLGKYEGGDRWLTPFGDEGNWYRCYHGVGRRAKERKELAEVVQKVAKEGLDQSKQAANGGRAHQKNAVYVSPDVDYAELYAGKFDIQMKGGAQKQTFETVFMFAVNPNKSFEEHAQTISGPLKNGPGKGKSCAEYYKNEKVEWLIQDPSTDNLRPYGLLFRPLAKDV